MTLARQLIFAVVLLFVVLYAGNVVVSLWNTQKLVNEQMSVHAQDTATSVAISMTQAAQTNDVATLDTLFNAVSDSGFYERITFTNLEGKIIIDREFPVSIAGVPDWFVNFVELSAKEGRAEVSSGWVRLGEVSVISHPGKAYAELWAVMIDQLLWFSIVTVLVCLAAYAALKWLLIPLRRVEEQADAICNQQFVVQNTIPKTRELASVVQAINRMSSRLKSIFENQLDLIKRLQTMAFRDAVTGLSNRADFDARLNSISMDAQGSRSAALMLFSLSDLTEVNELQGREAGNEILTLFGNRIQEILAETYTALVARRQGLEFAVLIEDIPEHDAVKLAEQLFSECYAFTRSLAHADIAVHMGFTHQVEVIEGLSLLKEADSALKRARLGKPSWSNYNELETIENVPLINKSLAEWQSFIELAISGNGFSMITQNLYSLPDKAIVGTELFTRFVDNGHDVSAGIVMPYAERLGMGAQVDKEIIQAALRTLPVQASGTLSINLTASAVKSESFKSWLKAFLNDNAQFAANLVLEVSEHIIQQSKEYVRDLNTAVSSFGTRLAVDNFGHEASSFSYLGSMPLAYLKVHRSFISGIDSKPDNQFYLKSLQQLTKSLDIDLIVEGVETQNELDMLSTLGVELAQGFFLARPEPVQ